MRLRRLGALFVAVAAALTVTCTFGVQQAAASPAASLFTPINPVRVLDTRSGLGAAGPIGPGDGIEVNLSADVPMNATAVVLNLTGVNATAATYVTAKSTSSASSSSNLNIAAGETRSNAVTLGIGVDRTIVLGNHSGSIDLIADLAGYYSPGSGSGYTATTPQRVLDTRNGTGQNGSTAPVGNGGTISLDLSGVVPSTATAVTFNLTALDATATTYVEVWPAGDYAPNVSSLNPTPGTITPILVTVALGTNRTVNLFNHVGSLDLVADLAGYYASDRGDDFYSQDPTRVLDTRTPPATLGQNASMPLDLSAWLPGNASAAVVNLTGTDTTGNTYVTAWPAANPRPLASNLNLVPGQTAANLTITGLSSGQLDLYNSVGNVDLIADLAGYFAAPPAPPGTGGVLTWGFSAHSQLGYLVPPGSLGSTSPNPVPGLSGVTQLAAGFATTYALLSDGTVRAWGEGDLNDLGNGTSADSRNPVPVSGLTGITQISGADHTGYALDSAHHVWAWGDNESGELGVGTTDAHLTPVQVPLPGPATSVVGNGIATGYALLADGTVWAWGESQYGQLGNGMIGLCGPAACQVLSPVQVNGLTGVVALYASATDAYAVKSDGTVWAWGWNAEGELAIGTAGGQNCYSAPTGADCAALSPVQVPALTGVADISGSFAIRTDGSVLAWGDDSTGLLDGVWRGVVTTPIVVARLSQIRSISMGPDYTVAVRTDGTLWVWGQNFDGELGSWPADEPPVQLVSPSGLTAAAAGQDDYIAVVY